MKVKQSTKTALKSVAFKLRKMIVKFGRRKKVEGSEIIVTDYGKLCVILQDNHEGKKINKIIFVIN